MNDGEAISEFFLKLMVLTNQMKLCREKIYELQKVEKVLRVLPAKFDQIIVAIEESKYLLEIKL